MAETRSPGEDPFKKPGLFDPKPASDVFAKRPMGRGTGKPRAASSGKDSGQDHATSDAEPLPGDDGSIWAMAAGNRLQIYGP